MTQRSDFGIYNTRKQSQGFMKIRTMLHSTVLLSAPMAINLQRREMTILCFSGVGTRHKRCPLSLSDWKAIPGTSRVLLSIVTACYLPPQDLIMKSSYGIPQR